MSVRISAPPATVLWPGQRLPTAIGLEEVHVWAWTFTGIAEPSSADLELLDEKERRKTSRFYFAPDKVRYSVCHANMRRILASYLIRDAKSLSYREDDGGKPKLVLEPSEAPLKFNLSHSKGVALLAVTLEAEVGVDVEDIRPIERDVATRFFSPHEIARISPLEGEDWLRAFYRCWTRKEAILKVEGLGLRIPLDSFDVSVLPEEPAALLAARPESKLTAPWRLHHLQPAEESMAALALASATAQISTFSLLREGEY